MYDDIWTGAKGFYKLEPVVADGGEVILYAPHIREISTSHPEIHEIGYHCRDYFVKQWDRVPAHPLGRARPLHPPARRRHLRRGDRRGAAAGGRHPGDRHTARRCAARSTWATCDPATVDVAAFEADPETLVVPRAGEVLFRLR